MDYEKAAERFCLILGISQSECDKWESVLCQAMSYVDSITRKKDLTQEDSDRLSSLAGVYACKKYLLYNACLGYDFRAGDLSVSSSKTDIDSIFRIWKAELSECAELVSDDPTVFVGVS